MNKRFLQPSDNLHFIYKAHVQVSQLFQGCNILLVTFRVKNIVSFCVKKLLKFALKSCYILRQKLLHFRLMLHFVSKVVTFRVDVTFCVNCYILRRNTRQFLLTKAQNELRFAGATISLYRPYCECSNSLLKSLGLQQRVSLFNSLKSSF